MNSRPPPYRVTLVAAALGATPAAAQFGRPASGPAGLAREPRPRWHPDGSAWPAHAAATSLTQRSLTRRP